MGKKFTRRRCGGSQRILIKSYVSSFRVIHGSELINSDKQRLHQEIVVRNGAEYILAEEDDEFGDGLLETLYQHSSPSTSDTGK